MKNYAYTRVRAIAPPRAGPSSAAGGVALKARAADDVFVVLRTWKRDVSVI